MTARNDLLKAFSPPHALDAWNSGIVAQAVDEILAKHAHELAEKIRAEVRQLKADGVLEPDKDWAASDAADLIDPEVSK